MILDFENLARDFNIPLLAQGHSRCSVGWVQTHCPFCTDGRRGWHLGFSLDRGAFNCWKCGSLLSKQVIQKLTGKPFGVLIQRYLKSAGGSRPAPVTRKRGSILDLPAECGKLQYAHNVYLQDRGFNRYVHLAETWGLLAVGRGERDWQWRIIIPVHDEAGQMVTYIGRSIAKDPKVRYRMLEDEKALASPNDLLYGEHLTDGDSVIVVEGATDAWRLGPGAVAVLGASWSPTQAARLLSYRRVFIMFDPDETGRNQAQKLADWLAPHKVEVEILTGFDTDPGNFDEETVKCIRQELGM